MKTGITILFLSAVFAAAQTTYETAIPYEMRNITPSSTLFKNILTAVRIEQLELELIEAKISTIDVKIEQKISEGQYLCSVPGDGRIIVVRGFSKENPLGDGDTKSVAVKTTGEMFEYVSLAGVGKTVHIFELRKLPEFLTPDRFVEQLKAGITYFAKRGTITTGNKTLPVYYLIQW